MKLDTNNFNKKENIERILLIKKFANLIRLDEKEEIEPKNFWEALFLYWVSQIRKEKEEEINQEFVEKINNIKLARSKENWKISSLFEYFSSEILKWYMEEMWLNYNLIKSNSKNDIVNWYDFFTRKDNQLILFDLFMTWNKWDFERKIKKENSKKINKIFFHSNKIRSSLIIFLDFFENAEHNKNSIFDIPKPIDIYKNTRSKNLVIDYILKKYQSDIYHILDWDFLVEKNFFNQEKNTWRTYFCT